jgi:eukaryotic-like serine/threonine-protein kinase
MELSAAFRAELTDRYAIERQIGQGGMATVFLARDLRHDRHVALKVLRPELNLMPGTHAGERFQSEIRVTANLQHPHLLPLFDSGEADGLLYYVMPYVPGESLRARLAREGQLPVAEAMQIAIAIAGALDYAHRQGVVHRDLKPENILLQDGQPLVADFGIALALREADETRLTMSGLSVGSPQYMSPEQAAGERAIDARTDVYALGAILYEMLAGRPPHIASTAQALVAKLLGEQPTSLRVHRDSVPETVEAVVMRALAKIPADRWSSAGHFRAALETAAGGTGSATTPSPVRRTAPLVALGAIALTVLAGVLFMWPFSREPVRPDVPPDAASLTSVAVVPFENRSPDQQDEYFSDGLTEELLHRLAQVSGLRVAARTSSFAFKGRTAEIEEIARQLQVDRIVSGSVRRAGSRLRVTVQLIEAGSGRPVWSEQYEREASDAFDVQDEIARAIAERLGRESTMPAAPTAAAARQGVPPEAFELYLKGRYEWNRRTQEGAVASLDLYSRALQLAPDYARAHAGLAEAYAVSGFYGYLPPHEAFTRAREAAHRALDLDPGMAESHNTLGYVSLYYDWDFEAAEQRFLHAIELSPRYSVAHQWYGNALTVMGRFDEAAASMRRAQEYDPLAPIAQAALGWTYMYARDYGAAERQLRTMLTAHPAYFTSHLWLAETLERSGRADEAIAVLDEARRLSPDNVLAEFARARALARLGRHDDARAALARTRERQNTQYVVSYPQALVLAALGDHEGAFAALEQALRDREHSIAFLSIDPSLDPLRASPRFQQLVSAAGRRSRTP